MNTSSQTKVLLMLSALSLPNVAWCWDDDSYRSAANPSGYSYHGPYGNTNHYNSYSNSRDDYHNERHHERRESPEEEQYRAKATALQQYYQAATEQKAETIRLQTEYLVEKQRMEAEAQLRGLQK
jgi:hypothetical protein